MHPTKLAGWLAPPRTCRSNLVYPALLAACSSPPPIITHRRAEFVEAGTGAPRLFDAQLTEPGLTGPEAVRRMLDQAKDTGLNLLRINAFATDAA